MLTRVQVQVMDDMLRRLFAQISVKTEPKGRPLRVGLYQDLAQKALMIQVWRAQVGTSLLRPHAVIPRVPRKCMHGSSCIFQGWGLYRFCSKRMSETRDRLQLFNAICLHGACQT